MTNSTTIKGIEEVPFYNSKEGIEHSLQNLDAFHEMLKTRRRAKEENSLLLDIFIVKGRWYLDQFGQISQIFTIEDKQYKNISEVFLKDIPDVLTEKEFFDRLIPYQGNYSHGWRSGIGIPKATTICPCCDKGWSIDNLHDNTCQSTPVNAEEVHNYLTEDQYATIANALAVQFLLGGPVTELRSYLNTHTGKNWYINYEDDDITKKITHYNITTFYHRACYDEKLELETRTSLNTAIRDSGIEIKGSIRVKNEYGSEEYRGPWFIFDTPIGHLKLGWRKRVIEINYSMIDQTYQAQTEHTSGPGYEHVYSSLGLTNALNEFKLHLKRRSISNPVLPKLILEKSVT